MVRVTANLTGLPKNASGENRHGFHIHETDDLSNDCKACGGHFNPKNKTHGGPKDHDRHCGDLGNIIYGNEKNVSWTIEDYGISIRTGECNIVNKSLVIHAGTDDLGKTDHPESKKTGNAGARIACCKVILKSASSKLSSPISVVLFVASFLYFLLGKY